MKTLENCKIKIATLIKKDDDKIFSDNYFTNGNFLIAKNLIDDMEQVISKAEKYPYRKNIISDKTCENLFDLEAPLLNIDIFNHELGEYDTYIYNIQDVYGDKTRIKFNKNYVEKIIKPLLKMGAKLKCQCKHENANNYVTSPVHVILDKKEVAIVMPCTI